jgi:histidinol phosphatase-like enzyme
MAGTVPGYAGHCLCRKPKPGLLWRATHDHALHLAQSWYLGETLDGVEAGKRAGCRTILLDDRPVSVRSLSGWRQPDHTATDLAAAVRIITKPDRLKVDDRLLVPGGQRV